MDSFIIYVVFSLVAGALVWTLGKYAWKIHSNPALEFNHAYLLTMLLSMVVSVTLTPLVAFAPLHSLDALPGAVWFGVLVAFAVGFTFNVLVNWPITYLVNRIEGLKKAVCPTVQAPLSVKTASKINVHKLLEAIVIVGLVFALLFGSVYAVVSYTANISGNGNVSASANLAVYVDPSGQTLLTNINWGSIPPGGSVNQVIYLKNSGNTPLTLSLASSWSPSSITSYLTLGWDYNGSAVASGSLVKVTLTLSAAGSAPNMSFTCSIMVTGTSQ